MNRRLAALLSVLLLLTALLGGCSSGKLTDSASVDMFSAEPTAEAYAEYSYDSDTPEPETQTLSTQSQETGTGVAGSQSPDLSEKMIYSASAEIETLDYEAAVDGVYALIDRVGGFLESSEISGADYASTSRGYTITRTARFVLRVPAESFAGASEQLNQLGNVTWLNTWAENITTQYYDTQSRMQAYETEAENLTQMLLLCDSVEEMIVVEDRLSEVQYQIDSLRSTLQNWQNQVDYSTITIRLQEVEEFTEAEPVQISYGQRLVNQLQRALQSMGTFFQDLLLWLVGSLPTIVLLLVLLLAVLLLRRRWLKKHPEHLTWRQRRRNYRDSRNTDE